MQSPPVWKYSDCRCSDDQPGETDAGQCYPGERGTRSVFHFQAGAINCHTHTEIRTLFSIHLPERGEDAVSHKDAEAVDKRQSQAYVLEIIVGASQ